MSFDADAIVDRRRMRRKLTFWRVTAVLVVLIAVVAAGFALVPGSRFMPATSAIARIKIQGLIRGNQARIEALDRLAKSRAVAVIGPRKTTRRTTCPWVGFRSTAFSRRFVA